MLKIGSLVDNKYRVLDVVGSGGMSTVYLVRNERANKSWAIKEVLKQGEENLEVKKNSLIAETEMLKKLNHPNLPAIVDVIETDDTFLVVMDYIEGNDLGDVLDEFGAQPQDKVIEWAKQICDVLQYLHTRNPIIIYRDLKPANIMLKPDGNLTLIDFGTAREAEIKDVANTVSLGTRGYAAPEQFGDGARADNRTDIYCFGATIYHLVTGHNPAEEPYVIERIRDINPSLSGGLEKIILKCTQPKPQDRYQSCEELMYDLEHYQEIDEIYKKKQKRRLLLFIASFVLCILCFCTSAYGHIKDSQMTEQRYLDYIQKQDYMSAIMLQPQLPQAYENIIELVQEDGNIIDKETTDYFDKFLENENLKNNGEIMYPINQMAENNIDDYLNICYLSGRAYWDNYQTPTARSNNAAKWFKRVLPDDYNKIDIGKIKDGYIYKVNVGGQQYSVTVGNEGNISKRNLRVALVCVKINDCKTSITSLSKKDSTVSSLSDEDEMKQSYQEFWKQLNEILILSQNIDDQGLQIILCNELMLEIDEYGIDLIKNLSIEENDILVNYIGKVSDILDLIDDADKIEKKENIELKLKNNKELIENYYEKVG